MNDKLYSEKEMYRHARFLQTLTLNEFETKLLRLFLKINQNFSVSNDANLKFEDNALNTSKIAVEF